MDGVADLVSPSHMTDPTRAPSRSGGVFNKRLSFGTMALARPSGTFTAPLTGSVRTTASGEFPGQLGSSCQPKCLPPARPECLTIMGLPGEDAATFIPLEIEPYEPPPDEPATTPTGAPSPSPLAPSPPSPAAAATEPRQVPSAQQPRSQPPSPPLQAASSPTATAVSPPYTGVMPRPPAGAAPSSSRRSLNRHPLHVHALSNGSPSTGPSVPPTPQTPPAALTSPQAACSPSTPAGADMPAAASPAGELLGILAAPAVSISPSSTCDGSGSGSSGGGGGGGVSRATLAFLDPSKPALRRRLPPLWRATNALYDNSACGDVGTSPIGSAGGGGGGSLSGGVGGSFGGGEAGLSCSGGVGGVSGGGGGGLLASAASSASSCISTASSLTATTTTSNNTSSSGGALASQTELSGSPGQVLFAAAAAAAGSTTDPQQQQQNPAHVQSPPTHLHPHPPPQLPPPQLISPSSSIEANFCGPPCALSPPSRRSLGPRKGSTTTVRPAAGAGLASSIEEGSDAVEAVSVLGSPSRGLAPTASWRRGQVQLCGLDGGSPGREPVAGVSALSCDGARVDAAEGGGGDGDLGDCLGFGGGSGQGGAAMRRMASVQMSDNGGGGGMGGRQLLQAASLRGRSFVVGASREAPTPAGGSYGGGGGGGGVSYSGGERLSSGRAGSNALAPAGRAGLAALPPIGDRRQTSI